MGNTGITVDSLKTQLAALQTAITNILTTGQSYVRPGFSLTHTDLPALQTERDYLIRAICRNQDGIIAVTEVGGAVSASAEDNWSNPESPGP